MRKELTQEEINQRIEKISQRPQEVPTPEDLAAILEAEAEPDSEMISLEEYKKQQFNLGSI